MNNNLYHYKAFVSSVYDGDTCTVDVDLGLGIWVKGEKIRLHRIDAPEVRGEEREAGLLSRNFLRDQIDNKEIIIQTVKDKKGKYGRYIAEIWIMNENGDLININDQLVSEGFAEYREY